MKEFAFVFVELKEVSTSPRVQPMQYWFSITNCFLFFPCPSLPCVEASLPLAPYLHNWKPLPRRNKVGQTWLDIVGLCWLFQTTITFMCLGMDSERICSNFWDWSQTVKLVFPWILLPEYGCGTCLLLLIRYHCNLFSVIGNGLEGTNTLSGPMGVVCVCRVK